MKRATLFAALVGILSLTAWMGDTRPAEAMVSCSAVAGRSCSPPGRQIPCLTSFGSVGGCSCYAFPDESPQWICTV